MRINPKSKGSDGERELAKLLTQQLGILVQRNLEQSRKSGADVILPGWSIEVKRTKRHIYKNEWWSQCLDRAQDGTRPALAYRADWRPWRIVVRMSDVTCPNSGYPDELVAELPLDSFSAWVRRTAPDYYK